MAPGPNVSDLKTPSLHGNNSEFGANEVNLLLSWVYTDYTVSGIIGARSSNRPLLQKLCLDLYSPQDVDRQNRCHL